MRLRQLNMNSIQISKALKKDPVTRRFFIGVFSCDQLPQKLYKYPMCLIVNTDPYSKPGKHWLAMYIPSPATLEFFDSYGHPPSYFKGPISRFSSRFQYMNYNDVPLQSEFSAVCGQYCIYFLYSRCRGRNLKSIVKSFHSNSEYNDIRVYSFVKKKFRMLVKFRPQ